VIARTTLSPLVATSPHNVCLLDNSESMGASWQIGRTIYEVDVEGYCRLATTNAPAAAPWTTVSAAWAAATVPAHNHNMAEANNWVPIQLSLG
jgi:hypothetical protein